MELIIKGSSQEIRNLLNGKRELQVATAKSHKINTTLNIDTADAEKSLKKLRRLAFKCKGIMDEINERR